MVLAAGAMSHETKHLCPSFGRAWGRADWACVRLPMFFYFSILVVNLSTKCFSMDGVKFDEYRLHFRPNAQTDIFINQSDVWERKNQLLEDVFRSEMVFHYKNAILNYLHSSLAENLHHFRIANKKVTKLEKNFQRTDVENEPSSNIFILNTNSEQKLFIESDRTSFGDSKVAAKIFENAINRTIGNYGLKVFIKAEIQESEFWDLVKEFQGKITSVEFNLLYPNLPKSHTTISDELKEVFQSIGSIEGSIEFKSEKGEVLKNLNDSNEQISSLNNAASLQGMPITIRVKNERFKRKTGKTKKTVQTIDISGSDQGRLLEVARELFKNL
jgi:hypothetical protein